MHPSELPNQSTDGQLPPSGGYLPRAPRRGRNRRARRLPRSRLAATGDASGFSDQLAGPISDHSSDTAVHRKSEAREADVLNLSDSETRDQIRRKALWFRRRYGLRIEIDDLCQAFAVHLCEVAKNYDPARQKKWQWVDTVLRNLSISVLREQRAQKRMRSSPRSLDAPLTAVESQSASLLDAIPDSRTPHETRRLELCRDLELLASRHPILQPLLRQARVTGCVPTLSQLRQTSRRIGDRNIRRLRRLFQESGLRDYL